MQLGYIIVYVQDVTKSMEFYERAFNLSPRFLHESQHYGEMDTGMTILAFASLEQINSLNIKCRPHDLQDLPCAVEVAFTTSNVEEAYVQALKAGACAVQPPQEKPWGQKVAYVRDCNGFLIELCTPVSL